jgi:hypothetical protein
MFSPYEELEFLADYLPDEGESVLITRESGELVCKPFANHDLRDGVDDAELYGLLVHGNERLQGVGAFPLWITVIVLFWQAILLHGVMGVGWQAWYVVPGAGLVMLYGTMLWIRHRQQQLFQREILPGLLRELSRRRIPVYALMAGVRQHGELRTLLDELVRWSPERDCR